MTVQQLIEALQQLPREAVVLLEGDTGYSAIGGLELEAATPGGPEEVILRPDLNE